MAKAGAGLACGAFCMGRGSVRGPAVTPARRARLCPGAPEAARRKFEAPVNVEFVSADVTNRDSLQPALAGASAAVNAVQFDGYPAENPRRGLTFERVDYGGTAALLAPPKTRA